MSIETHNPVYSILISFNTRCDLRYNTSLFAKVINKATDRIAMAKKNLLTGESFDHI